MNVKIIRKNYGRSGACGTNVYFMHIPSRSWINRVCRRPLGGRTPELTLHFQVRGQTFQSAAADVVDSAGGGTRTVAVGQLKLEVDKCLSPVDRVCTTVCQSRFGGGRSVSKSDQKIFSTSISQLLVYQLNTTHVTMKSSHHGIFVFLF